MPPRKRRGRPPKVKPSKCLRCSTKLGESYQPIFDKTGVDLDLQNLLSVCFDINIEKSKHKIQALCDECLNQLIEVFDVMQKNAQEETEKGSNCDIEPGITIKEEDESSDELHTAEETTNLHEPEEETTDLCSTNKIPKDEQNNDSDCSDKSEKLSEAGEFHDNKSGISNDIEEKSGNNPEEFENIDYLDDYDEKIDFREYKSKVLRSKFLDIVFPEDIICRLCSQSFNKHADIITHVEELHCVDDFAYPCPIDENCEPLKSSTDLSFHLVLKHYDLQDLTIYSHCSECDKRFNNIMSYNKHYCYQGDKISRSATECEICDKTFKSNKRYRFHQQFHQEKRRPKACFICDKQFRDEDEFFEHIMYSHEQKLGFICISCDRSFTSEENLKNHESIHRLERPYCCKLCNKSYLYAQLLKDHMTSKHGENPFKCQICDKYFIKKTLLNRHTLSHNKPEPAEMMYCSACGLIPEDENETEDHLKDHEDEDDAKFISEVLETAYCCEYCELAYKTVDKLFVHRKNHYGKEFLCDMCPLSYDEYKKLKTHKLTHINYVDKRKTFPVLRHYVCDFPNCTLSYLHWTSLRSHKRHKHSGKDEYKCPKCLASFKNAVTFKNHMDQDHMGAAFECQFCDNTYGTKMALAVHIARKHNTSRFCCDSCTNSYATEELLIKHKTSIHNNFTCEICGKVVKNLKNLQVHQRMVHEKEKRYFCQYCNKGYFNNCDKVDHEKSVHEKFKKYKCELCPYAAVYKESLTIHMRGHRNETPFICKLCGKGFRRSYALELHTRRHYDIRNFKCPHEGCNSAYPNQGILNSHLRSKHGCDAPSSSTRKRKTGTESISRPRFSVLPVDTFIDDDDGLNDGVIGEPRIKIIKGIFNEEEISADVDYIVEESELEPAVIVEKNESDHDYIVRLDENKIYGNTMEEYVVEDAIS